MTTFIETLNRSGDQFLKFAWPMFWQSSLLIAVIFVLEFALRRKVRAAIRYALWLMVLVKLLLPPSLALPTSPTWWIQPTVPPPAKAPPVSFTVSYGEQMAPDFPPPPSSVIPPARAPAMSFAAWTLAASGVVSAGLLAWLLVRWRQINQKVRRAKASEKLIPVLDEARRLTRLRPGIRLKLTEDSMSPAVCGLFRPVILLPQSLVERLSAGQLRAVLLHEAIHLRRGDVWVNCAQALLQIFYWWHPLLWLANARIRRVREEAVDDAVMLALRDDAEIYASTLLEVAKLAFNRPLASLGLVGILESRSALRQRIERLVNFNAPRKAGLTVVSILGILAFSAVALPMGQAPEKTNAPTASVSNLTIDTNAPEKVFKAGTGVNTVTGLLSDTNFLVVLHALEQRTGTGTVAEPEAVTTAGRGANQINRMVVPDKIDIPTITTNATESAILVQDGKLLYEMGKFDEAGVKLNQALKLDPANPGAFYYLNLVRQADFAGEEHNHTNQAANSIEEVAKAWSPKVGIGMPVPNPYVTNNDVHTSPAREAIYKKLNLIRLDSVPWFNGISLSEAMRFMTEQSKLLDPEKIGINFVYVPSAEPGMSAAAIPTHLDPATGRLETTPATTTVDASTINVKLIMKDVSLRDLLDAVVRAADHPIKYSVEDYAVVISPKASGPEPPKLEMRIFKVDPYQIAAGLRGIPGLQTNNVATMAQSLFSKLGMDLPSTGPGRSMAYNDKLGLLFVKATPSELDTIERVVQTMNQAPPQIHIKARFIEVEQENNARRGFDWYLGSFTNGPIVANGGSTLLLAVPVSAANPLGSFSGNTTTSVIPASATDQQLTSGLRNTAPAPATVTGILTDPNFRVTLHALESRPRTTILAEPECVTTSGRQTQMRATDIDEILTNFTIHTTSSNSPSFVPQIGKMEIGPVVDVVPYVLSDGYTINLTVTASVTEFLGYAKPTNSLIAYINGHKQTVPVPLPKFRTQKISTVVNLWDNQTLVLGGPVTSATETIKHKVPLLADLPLIGGWFQSQTENSVEKKLMVFVTATIVDPAGNRVHSDDGLPFNPSTVPQQPQFSSPSP
jgi:type II secretory pathway component GspD/PulD (secretin)/beta-lactamase regulating signal transducer with metallopeptidase domain